MIENKLEMDIIRLYDNNLVNLFSINQIASMLGKKYPYVNRKVTEMLEEGILNKTVVGKSYLCSLNFTNERTIIMLSLMEASKKKPASWQKAAAFIEKTRLSMTTHCVVSYGDRLLFVIEDLRDRRKVEREIPGAVVADKGEFLDMLGAEKELFIAHAVLYGKERFFELLTLELDELKKRHSPLKY